MTLQINRQVISEVFFFRKESGVLRMTRRNMIKITVLAIAVVCGGVRTVKIAHPTTFLSDVQSHAHSPKTNVK